MEQATLYKYFRGETSVEEEKAILDWVESSEENLLTFQNERLLYDTILFTTDIEEEPIAEKKVIKISSVLKWSVRAAAVFIVLLSSFHLLNEYVVETDIQLQQVIVPAGQRVNIILADGTSVWLNAKSTLEYNTDFGKKKRIVNLDGEAYFQVAKNEKVPFLVNTEYNVVKVLGTSFNVSAYKGSKVFNTSLVEGSVEVYMSGSEKPLVQLSKNEYLNIANGTSVKGNVRSTDFLRWREGLYCFDDMSFRQILDKLELYYDVDIVVETPKVLNYSCTGKFKEQDGIDHILRVIQKDHQFDYTIDKDNNIITIK